MQRPAAGIDAAQVIWRELANCSLRTWSLPKDFHFDALLLTATYRRAAIQHGLISPAGRLRAKPFGAALLCVTAQLRVLPELAALPSSVEEAGAQFSRVLQHPRGMGHPLRHLALILALFHTWENFWAAYEQERLATSHPEPLSELCTTSPVAASDYDDRKVLVLAMLGAGSSASAAAATAGVATGTALVWAAQASIPTSRRPKTLKPDLHKAIVRALRRGADKRSVAESYGVSVQTVTMTLRSEIGLSEQWAEARRIAARRRARSAWREVASRYPQATATEIRRRTPAAFAWLYRNDRAWLEEQSRLRPEARPSVGARVDWDQRDRHHARQLSDAALTLATARNARHVTIGMLCQVLPELKPLLGKLDRMPLTEAALKNATRRRGGPESGGPDLL